MMGNKTYLRIGLIAASVFLSGIAVAAPQNGIGVYLGMIGATQNNSVNSSGLSLGVDAQFVLNDNWSLAPYLMVSSERDNASHTVSDGLAGVSLRRWFGEWFAGPQVFEHDLIVMSNGTVNSSAYGLSGGLVAGFEYANGWGAEAQADLFESTMVRGVQRNALRLHLTYRWH